MTSNAAFVAAKSSTWCSTGHSGVLSKMTSAKHGSTIHVAMALSLISAKRNDAYAGLLCLKFCLMHNASDARQPGSAVETPRTKSVQSGKQIEARIKASPAALPILFCRNAAPATCANNGRRTASSFSLFRTKKDCTHAGKTL